MIKVIASAAMSLDGYIDDCSTERLNLSSKEDWNAVHTLRAQCDAILIGAGTLRADNPSLTVKDTQARKAAGLNEELAKVTVTASGEIDPQSRFFTVGSGCKVVFVLASAPKTNIERLRECAEVVVMEQITAKKMVAELERMGFRKLMVEGGAEVLTMFFAEDAVDRLRLAVAPFFVGDSGAPRLVNGARFPADKLHRMALCSSQKLGDMAVMHYVRHGSDAYYMAQAVELSRKSPKCMTSYCVGAIIVTRNAEQFAGYTHETAPNNHAEEEAMIKAIQAGAELAGATIYCTMEPCSQRSSKPKSCSQLIIEHGMARVVTALREPDRFVECQGVRLLAEAGIAVDIVDEFADEVLAINAHVL